MRIANNKTVSWVSSNEEIAIVDNRGYVIAKKKGNATRKAITEEGNYEAECIINVQEPVTGVILNKESIIIDK